MPDFRTILAGKNIRPFLAPTTDLGALTGIQVAFKADGNLFSDAGVTPSTNNTLIAQWNDYSGNANNASWDNSGNSQPTFLTNIQNGHPAAKAVAGFVHLLWTNEVTLAGTWTLYLVGLRPGTNTRWCWISSTGRNDRVFVETDNKVHATADAATDTSVSWTSTDNAWIMIRMRRKADDHVYIQATGMAEVDMGHAYTGDNFHFNRMFDAGSFGEFTSANAFWGELGLTNVDTPTVHPAEDTAAITYLTSKWNVTFP